MMIGILGGTGLYDIDGFENKREVRLRTPFGMPSGPYVVGTLEGRPVAFLARHGRGHHLLPAEVNYRANIFGFKSVGSLREEIHPRDMVLAGQFFDRTRRPNTFFGDGIVAHVSLGQPVCPKLAGVLYETAVGLGLRAHRGGTYICIEGPAFSTKAESLAYRAWGGDVIGMTAATEARLCREAEICYATLCLATDYDVWHETEEPVTVELILQNLAYNSANAKAVIKKALGSLAAEGRPGCTCASGLANTIVTAPSAIPAATRKKLGLLVDKYLG
jgi:5'-methylthioadenosine phosphorylase